MMEKMWTIYILECGDGTLYTGITDDLQRRLKAHSEGKGAKYTRGRGPLTLRYREEAADKGTALKREYAIKQMHRREKLAMIAENEKEIKSWLAFCGDRDYTKDSTGRGMPLAGEE